MIKFYRNNDTKEVRMGLKEEYLKENEVEIKANSTDAALEKHVPVVTVDGNKLHAVVGSTIHPMTEAHHIVFIVLVTDNRAEMKMLNPTGAPEADFTLAEGEKPLAVYEYCNLHGLWVKNLD